MSVKAIYELKSSGSSDGGLSLTFDSANAQCE